MLIKQLMIINKLGLHARAAAKLVSLAASFQSDIKLEREGRVVNGKSILGVMMLAAGKGSIITLHVAGADEAEALNQLEALVETRFGEAE